MIIVRFICARPLEQYENLTFAADESGADKNKEKIRCIRRLLSTEKMRIPFHGIHSMVTPRHGSGISKLFVLSGIKNKKVAARYCNPDGSVTRE